MGFYGGVNYGFGYGGVGFEGGAWNHGVFAYNRAVTNVSGSVVINNTYNKTVVVNNTTTTSFNGAGGTTAQPTASEQAAANEKHIQPTSEQTQHEKASLANPQQKASVNGGKPAVAATPKPGQFTGKGVVTASKAGAPYHAANVAAKTDRPATATTKSNTVNTNKPATSTNKPATSTNKPPTSTNKPATSTSTTSNKPAVQNKSTAKPQASKPAPPPKKTTPKPENHSKDQK
jgi:hypothetical protein